jgi:hypothetical protein
VQVFDAAMVSRMMNLGGKVRIVAVAQDSGDFKHGGGPCQGTEL